MSGVSLFNKVTDSNEAAYEEYIGTGVAHRPPPKRMKLTVEEETLKNPPIEIEDPRSRDVFIGSQDSQSSHDAYFSCEEAFAGNSEITPIEKVENEVSDNTLKMPDEKSEDVFNNPEDDGIPDDEEEELVEDSQDTLSQSRQSTSKCYSEEFENSYMTDLDHTLPPEMRKHRGEEGKVEKIREANDTLNQNPAVDTAIINDANRFRSPVKTPEPSPAKSDEASRLSKKQTMEQILKSPSTPVSGSANRLAKLEIDEHDKKCNNPLEESRNARSRNDEQKTPSSNLEHPSRHSAHPKSTPDRHEKASSNSSRADAHAHRKSTPNRHEKQPSPNNMPTRSTDSTKRSYVSVLERQLKFFQEDNQRVFLPNLDNTNPNHDVIYCRIPGLAEQPKPNCREGTILQDWRPFNERGFKNEDYTRRKRLMENYLLEYLPGGYHLFINLFEQLFETPDNKMLKLPALEKWFLEESRRFGADRPLLDSFANVVRLALTAERVLPKKIYSLHPPMMSATFSQEQCAALLAQRFFKNDMIGILQSDRSVAVEKIKFLMTYFNKVSEQMPQGNVSFRLVEKQPNFEEIFQSRNPPNVKIVKGMKIEETALSTQVDFANRDLGGGVLNNGMVQEEIRFMMCPEMIVGMIVCSRMKQNQAISIVGAQAYSSYSGYSYNTKWEPLKRCDERQNTPEWRDKFQRLRIECLAIDALHFKGTPQTTLRQQLKREMIFRELHKAYVGFSAQPGFTEIPIVSGWWGCGAFNGNKPLKFLIQVIAAAAAKRPLLICPFNENEMADDCRKFIGTIMKENMTCGNLLRLLMKLAGQNPPEEFSENIVFASLEHELKKNKREVAEKRK